MRHEPLSTCSKFLITRERAKPRFRAKIGDFRANRAVSRQDGWRGSRMKERRSFSCVVGVSPVACGVRAARCQSRRVLGVSRVVRSHRVVRSLASSRRLSSRVVCRRVVRSLESSRRLSSRVVCRLAVRRPGLPVRRPSCSMSVASCAESFQSRLVVRRPAGRCQSRRVLSPATLSC